MKLNKTISFRSDIDTISCIKKGVPLLVDISKDLVVRFTFFMNFGRSIKQNSKIEAFLGRTPKFINFTKLNKTNIK